MKKALEILNRYWLVLLFLVLVIAGVGMYTFGYRISINGLEKTGTVIVNEVPEGTQVFADESRITIASGGKAHVELLPGSHSIIVAAPGMQPWNELVIVTSGVDSILSPVLVPVEVQARKLSGEERALGADAILAYPLPLKDSPLRLANGCALVYVANNRIVADATTTPECSTPPEYLLCTTDELATTTSVCPSTVVFPPNERLESVSAFPGRDDALVVAAGGQAYVVELDPRTPQFFAPIMRGARVRAAPWTESSIVISDTKQVYELPL
jgi:hypothetical protein